MSRWELITFAGFGLLCASYGLAPEYAATTTLVAVLVGTLSFVHHRASARAADDELAPLGASVVVRVSPDGPDAFLLGVRGDESGESFVYCTGECPNPAIEMVLGRDGSVDVPSGSRRSVFEMDGQLFVVAHRRAGALPTEIRSGKPLERLRELTAIGRPTIVIGAGRMEILVEGTADLAARDALSELARLLHELAEAGTAESTERGVYR